MIRVIRREEKKKERSRSLSTALGSLGFGVLGLALLYFMFNVITMESSLRKERHKLEDVEKEYLKYKASKLFVDKADIELLDELQSRRIFWTKKLIAMATHLPENYWIAHFGFNQKQFSVSGFGMVSQGQNQLIILDNYFNELRSDSNYKDVFPITTFNSTRLEKLSENDKVSFDFVSTAGLGRR